MNTKKYILDTVNSARTPVNSKWKSASEIKRMGATDAIGEAGNTASPMVALPPSFVALAGEFGMVPERLAERVIAAFSATKPTRIIVKAEASSGRAVH